MRIRKAQETDLPALFTLYDRLYDTLSGFGLPFSLNSDEMKGVLGAMLKSRFCLITVAEEDGRIVGFLSAGISRMDRKLQFQGQNMIGIVSDIYVEPALRGKGVAKELLACAEDWFRENGIGLIESYVVMENHASAAFFKKHGYSDMSRLMMKTL